MQGCAISFNSIKTPKPDKYVHAQRHISYKQKCTITYFVTVLKAKQIIKTLVHAYIHFTFLKMLEASMSLTYSGRYISVNISMIYSNILIWMQFVVNADDHCLWTLGYTLYHIILRLTVILIIEMHSGSANANTSNNTLSEIIYGLLFTHVRLFMLDRSLHLTPAELVLERKTLLFI